MKIATFNANGIRARMNGLLEWLHQEAPDVLCIQETKVQDPDFPLAPLKETGYHCAFKGQKAYNGVAILSRQAPEDAASGFGPDDDTEGPRLIRATFTECIIVNTYIPQGQAVGSEKFEYKLNWYARLREYYETNFTPDQSIIWVGDFNVAPTSIDVYDPEKLAGSVCFHPDEHKALASVMGWGFTDIFRKHRPEEKSFSFWDYRIPNAVKRGLGWRIDHICATKPAVDRSVDCWIDIAPRMKPKPSDHTYVVAEFDL